MMATVLLSLCCLGRCPPGAGGKEWRRLATVGLRKKETVFWQVDRLRSSYRP